MHLRLPSLAALSALAALAGGCGDARSSTNPLAASAQGNLCVSCHGGRDNQTGAPPFDLAGNSDTTAAGVGAHTAHVQTGALAAPFGCGECHEAVPIPATPDHMDGKVQLPFGALAKTGGVTPAFDPGATSCATTYCHGATLQGGTHTTPVWTKVGQGEAACGTCHGLPPAQLPGPNHPTWHVAEARCAGCHPGTATVDASGKDAIVAGGGLHVNGTVDVDFPGHPAGWYVPGVGGDHTAAGRNPFAGGCATAACHGTDLAGGRSGVACAHCHDGGAHDGYVVAAMSCVLCHGGADNQTGAPPVDTHGVSLTSSVTVGAHTSHVEASHGLSLPIDCSSCHVKPASVADPGHIDGPTATVVLSTAGTYIGTPTWNRNAATCASSYCHGNFPGGNLYNQPTWTTVNGTQATCGSCHGIPPLTGQHDFHVRTKGYSCNACHPVQDSAASVDPATHVNGAKDVINPITGWNPAAKTCNAACHTVMPNPAPWYF